MRGESVLLNLFVAKKIIVTGSQQKEQQQHTNTQLYTHALSTFGLVWFSVSYNTHTHAHTHSLFLITLGSIQHTILPYKLRLQVQAPSSKHTTRSLFSLIKRESGASSEIAELEQQNSRTAVDAIIASKRTD